MKKLLIALSLALAATGAYAKDEKAATPQQSRMADCNKEAKAKDMKGDERKAFMKSCLSGKPAAEAKTEAKIEAKTEAKAEAKKELTPQQQKMQDCNKEAKAKDMKGPDRKKFMSGCLKGDAKPAEAKPAEAKKPDAKK
ncbi:MAG: hypothetical protein A2Z44_04285 [Betaproteobacteria bacterium RBG_19FT_COMBO_58_11]|nr:MAG: hypothetical protein A2Z44_04285 [Betaproteobacteria bacterium RBG_19FT_COMBO_58_11]